MPHPLAPSPPPAASPLRLLVRWALALAGLALFVYLVSSSGITVALLAQLGWLSFALLLLIASGSQVFDTVGWYFAIRHLSRPRPGSLFRLRVAGDAMTNALPGGVVLGETYKAAMMRRIYGVSIADNAATLLTVKFALAFSQAVFILGGVGLSYGVLREGGPQVLGIAGAERVAVALTAGFALLLAVPAVGMARGSAFASSCRALARLPIPPLRRALQRNAARIDALDAASTQVLRHNRRNLALSFLACLGGWLVAVLESYLLLNRMGLSSSLRVAYVIESVGSIFRMIFFFVPSGIGAQDVSFVALFKLYRFPIAPAGAFVLLKRGKELCWIGIGFVLLALQRRSAAAPSASVDGSGDGTYAAPAQERSE